RSGREGWTGEPENKLKIRTDRSVKQIADAAQAQRTAAEGVEAGGGQIRLELHLVGTDRRLIGGDRRQIRSQLGPGRLHAGVVVDGGLDGIGVGGQSRRRGRLISLELGLIGGGVGAV